MRSDTTLRREKRKRKMNGKNAQVLERLFLVMWLVTGFVMSVFILYVVVDVSNKWDSM